jgi:hypothetical protein
MTQIGWRIGLMSAILSLGLAVASSAGAAERVAGWDIQQVDSGADGIGVCVASGPVDGPAALSLSAEGPAFLLIVGAPDFPADKGSYAVDLAFDGKPPVHTVGLGENGVMGIGLGTGPARIVAGASRVSMTVDGHTHQFSLRNAAKALDAVARCAGETALSERVEQPATPIPAAERWTLIVNPEGSPRLPCTARNPGDQVDTILMLNNRGQLVLVGGHSDWATWGGQVDLQLAIDGGPPVQLSADTVQNLILTSIEDPALLQRLRSAKTLDWTIPTGHVRGDVTGLGVALDAVAKCNASRGSDRPSPKPAG